MTYLEKFKTATVEQEENFYLNFPYQLEMACFTHDVYPFKVFPQKGLCNLSFAPITIFYGSNGSGKSTLLNVIAQKLKLSRSAPFNNTPYFEDYLKLCNYETHLGRSIPKESKLIASDDVFDFLLDVRAINEGINNRREKIFEEYRYKREHGFSLSSLEDYSELRSYNQAKSKTKSQYTAAKLPKDLNGKSNGESAVIFFTQQIKENALYLLDEPENSLSPKLVLELKQFLEDSARFFSCQFIISTHSPFLLSLKDARIYDLDSNPVSVKKWTELENVRVYKDFFDKHSLEF
ncbi:MAG: AAA family ATPase [Oscillospiraceae bacterium]|nr:AAA family ATPase [Oscillospiraceae bacterium]